MDKGLLVAGGVLALALVAGGGSMYAKYRQRGIRNNNPGNLVLTGIAWKGKVPESRNTDGRFEQFTAPEWGIRAMFMDIRSDIRKGANTVRRLITEYAPPHENNTAAYIAAVASAIGKSADAVITDADYPALVKAIIKHENGIQPYPDSLIVQAIGMA